MAPFTPRRVSRPRTSSGFALAFRGYAQLAEGWSDGDRFMP